MSISAGFRMMSRKVVGPLLAAGLGLVLSPPAIAAEQGGGPPGTAELEKIFSGFYQVPLDLDHPRQVRNLVLRKDALELTLRSGTLYLTQPFEGTITGAYFSGDGIVKITLPNETERKSLKRWTGKDTFDEPISEVVMRFDDGSEAALSAAEPGGPSVPDAKSTWETHSKIQYNSGSSQLDFIESRLGGVKGHDFFYFEARSRENKWFYFGHSPGSERENHLLGEKHSGAAGKRLYERWNFFHQKSDYDDRGNYNLIPEADDKHPAILRNVDLSVTVPDTKTIQVDARVTVESAVDGLQVLRFDLTNNMYPGDWDQKDEPVTVWRVFDSSGADLPFIHKWDELVVLLPQALGRGRRAELGVTLTEPFWTYPAYTWYPQMGYIGGRYTFDWTLKIGEPGRAVGSGELVREWTEKKMNCSQWRSTVPVSGPSVVFSDYKTSSSAYQPERPGAGPVKLNLYIYPSGKLKPENILFNVQQGIKAYESIFGPFPYPNLQITQMRRLGFSQSPPGILLLSDVMSGTGGGGWSDQVLFHELAHQYWGNQVGWVGSEDQWISESWAEYSSGLITEGIDPKKFEAMRKEWKRIAQVSEHEATIATAYRSEWREGLLYNKGPYVVHMLRNWMGWERFSRLVGTLQSKYKGRDINTDTVAREASSLMGYDMFPFFDQWVRGTGIPKIHYSWSSAPEPDGKILVTLRTRQEDRENLKIMLVPIFFDFGKEKPVVVPKPITAAETEIKVKVPVVPKEVRLDDDETQLAEFIRDK